MKKRRLSGGKTSLATKKRYVKRQKQNRPHECHWPGCTEQVPPAMWGCRRHWFKLPHSLRNRLWLAYRPGQERTMSPSREYMKVAKEVQDWIKEHGQ